MILMNFSLPIIVLLVLIALLIGFNKTAVPSLGLFIVTLLMMIFPAKVAIGVMLPMLMVADVYAIIAYRHSVDWKRLIRLLPWVVSGVFFGYITLTIIDEQMFKYLIGSIILFFILIIFFRRYFEFHDRIIDIPFVTVGMGGLGGFATTVANAGGEVMSIYLLLQRLPKAIFVGTVAYFFFVLNWVKLPLFWYLNLVDMKLIKLTITLSVFILLGAFIGEKVLPHIKQHRFNQIIIFLTFLGAINLFIS